MPNVKGWIQNAGMKMEKQKDNLIYPFKFLFLFSITRYNWQLFIFAFQIKIFHFRTLNFTLISI